MEDMMEEGYNLLISDNSASYYGRYDGGGIHCSNSVLELQDITLTNNSANNGGGIYIYGSSPMMHNVIIDSNSAILGAGIFCSQGSSPVLKNVKISNNSASEKGGGLFCNKSIPEFDSKNRCNIYLNNAIWGNDLFSDTIIQVIVDTFTVLYPEEFHAEPLNNYVFDILHGKIEQTDADLFVSPEGDNANSGFTSDKPLKTIRYAFSKIMADSLHQNTIQLLEGTYSSSGNGEAFPLNIPDYINIQGASETGVILDAEGQSSVMIIDNNNANSIAGLTITGGFARKGGGIYIDYSNPLLHNVSIINNSTPHFATCMGGGIYCYYSNPELRNVSLLDNSSKDGGGIYCDNSNPVFQDVTISNNNTIGAFGSGGGLYCTGSHPSINNVTISGNLAGNGGGIYCDHSHPTMQNVEISGNSAKAHKGAGGGGIYCINSNPYLQEVNITNNTAREFGMTGGGGMYCYNSNPTLLDVIISDNLATNGGGLFLDNNSNPDLQNVNISNNISNKLSTVYTGGGGICCKSSSPSLQNVQIISNYSRGNGGGIACISNSRPSFLNVTISDNSTPEYGEYAGGGVYCDSSFLDFESTLISNNYALIGGGIYLSNNSISTLKLVNIKNNSATAGGGIYCSSSSPAFDNTDRCNIYFNNAVHGNDLYSDTLMEVVVDTFSVLYPTDKYAEPLDNFTFDILHGKIEQLDADLYVSPDGQNTNSGLTADEPLQTIRDAFSKILTDSLHPHTIHLLEGTYSPSGNGEFFPINIVDHISLSGESRDEVILDAEGQSGVLIIDNNKSTKINGLTITGGFADNGGGIYCNNSSPVLHDLMILNNRAKSGGGVYCNYSSPELKNVIISNDSAAYGGGFYCYYSNPELLDVLITDNLAARFASSSSGGGMYCSNSSPGLENVIISGNSAVSGGGFYCEDHSSPYLINTFLTGNSATEPPWGVTGGRGGGIYCNSYSSPVLVNVQITGNTSVGPGSGISCYTNCNPILVNVTIADNSSDDVGGAIYAYITSSPQIINSILWNNSPDEVYGSSINIAYSDIQGGWTGEGNIDEAPLFIGSGEYPYALSASSLCINTGIQDTTGLMLPLYDIIGNPRIWDDRVDMGAYEWNNLSFDDHVINDGRLGLNIFPNPCSGVARFRYQIKDKRSTICDLYQISGIKLKRLLNEEKMPGTYEMEIDVRDLPDGLYIVRLQTGNKSAVGKLLVVH
jgi:hypothetical protein